MKESIIVFASTVEASKKLNKEQFVKFWTNYFDYGLNDKPFETDDVALDILFTATKPNIDNAIKRYNNCVENGKKGGRPKNQSNNQEITKEKPRNNQEETKVEKSVNLNDNVNEDDNDTGNCNDYESGDNTLNEKEEYDDDNTTSTCNDNDFENVVFEKEKTFCDTGLTVPEGAEVVNNENESSFEDNTSLPTSRLVIDNNDDTPIPVFEDGFKNKVLAEWVNNFKANEGEPVVPSREQLMAMAYIENLSFSKKDFKLVYGGTCTNGYWTANNKEELCRFVANKMNEFVGKYNFKYRSWFEVYQDMICSFLNKNYDHFKIKVPEE